MFLPRQMGDRNFTNKSAKISLFTRLKNSPGKKKHRRGEASRCACRSFPASITLETTVVLPFFACFMVFILFFFRIMQVQVCIAQALQYTGRTLAAECSAQAADTEEKEDRSLEAGETADFIKAKAMFGTELAKFDCPYGFVSGGLAGIHLLGSDVAGNYIELKASYQMKLPVGLVGDISYKVVQEVKCRKWTGYQIGEDGEDSDAWLYFTEYGSVYHTSRSCAYLDLSISAVPLAQVGAKRNQGGGIYHPCELCNGASGGMGYITKYGSRYHTTLTCSGLKRSIYMIRRSQTQGKPLCKKCGGS